MDDEEKRWNADRIGAYASFACAVHCLLTSLAFGLLSVVGLGFVGSPPFEIGFIVLAVSIGSFAVWSGYRKHRSILPGVLFFLGLSLIFLSHFVFTHEQRTGEVVVLNATSGIVAAIGGLTIVAFHFVNAHLSQCLGHEKNSSP